MADSYTSRTLREIIRVVASRFLGMLIIIAAVVAAVWVATDYAPKEYRSEVPLMAEPEQPIELLPRTAAASLPDKISLFVNRQREIILSDWVLASALLCVEGEELPLRYSEVSGVKVAPDAKQNLPNKEIETWNGKVEKYKAENIEYLGKVRKRVSVVTPGGLDRGSGEVYRIRIDWPEERELAAKLNMDSQKMAAQRARKMALYVLDSYLMRYTHLERERAKEEARGYEGISLEVAKADRDEAVKKRQELVDGLAPELRVNFLNVVNVAGASGIETGIAVRVREDGAAVEKLSAEEKELAFYLVTSIAPQTKKLDELLEIEKQFDQVELRIAAGDPEGADGELKEIVERIREFSIVVPDDAATGSPAVKKVQEKATFLRLELDRLTTGYKYAHEGVRNAARELLNVWKTLGREMRDQEQKVSDQIGRLKARRTEIEKRLFGDDEGHEGNQHMLAKLVSVALEYDQLNNRVKSATDNFNKAQEKKGEAETRRRLAQNPILASVMDTPSRADPADPRRPIFWLNMVIAGAAGVILAFIYAFMADHFDHTIKGIDDAERYLGAPVLVSIPKLGFRVVRTRRRT